MPICILFRDNNFVANGPGEWVNEHSIRVFVNVPDAIFVDALVIDNIRYNGFFDGVIENNAPVFNVIRVE